MSPALQANRALLSGLEEVARRRGFDRLCDDCGGLRPDSSAVLLLRWGETARECAGCGLLLGVDNKPRGVRQQDGRVYVRVVTLDPRREGKVE